MDTITLWLFIFYIHLENSFLTDSRVYFCYWIFLLLSYIIFVAHNFIQKIYKRM